MALGSGGELDLMLPFREECIICGDNMVGEITDLNTADNHNSVYGMLYYVTHNFGQFTRLAIMKTFAFFGLSRGYYSKGHNFYLVTFFYTIYGLVILSLPYWFGKA